MNGVEVDRVAQYGTTRVTDTNLVFGARSFGDSVITHYKGLMDEIGVWNRALTDEEVIQLWNNGTGIGYVVSEPEPSLEERLGMLEGRVVELEQEVEGLDDRVSWVESMVDKIVDFIIGLSKGLSKGFVN